MRGHVPSIVLYVCGRCYVCVRRLHGLQNQPTYHEPFRIENPNRIESVYTPIIYIYITILATATRKRKRIKCERKYRERKPNEVQK